MKFSSITHIYLHQERLIYNNISRNYKMSSPDNKPESKLKENPNSHIKRSLDNDEFDPLPKAQFIKVSPSINENLLSKQQSDSLKTESSAQNELSNLSQQETNSSHLKQDLSSFIADTHENKSSLSASTSSERIPLKLDCNKTTDAHADSKKNSHSKKRNNNDNKGKTLFGSKKGNYESPNYFVSFQVSNPIIHNAIVDLQAKLLEGESSIESALIDVATLHITLFVLRISDDETLQRACSALDHCGASLSESLSKLPIFLSFKGLSHFNHKVLFAQPIQDESYHRLLHTVNKVKSIFTEEFEVSFKNESFVPHLTIAKLSKMERNEKGKPILNKIDEKLYKPYVDMNFGVQVVQGLQLLSMEKPKDKKGYYFNERQINFDMMDLEEESDHSKCCFSHQPLITPSGREFSTTAPPSYVPKVEDSLPVRNRKCSSSAPKEDSFGGIIMKSVIGSAFVLSLAFVISRILRN